MRLAVIYPGPHFAVRDVARGYHFALAQLGYNVLPIDLPKRLDFFADAVIAAYPDQSENADFITSNSVRMATEAIVIECIRQRIEMAIIVSGMHWHGDGYELLRRVGIPCVSLLTECPYDDEGQTLMARESVAVFVNDRLSLRYFHKVNPKTWYLPAAYDPDVHFPRQVGDQYETDVMMVGTGFGGRQEFLAKVDWDGIDFRLFGLWQMERGNVLQKYYKQRVMTNDQAVWWYAGTKIGLNIHRNDKGWAGKWTGKIAEAYSCNPRVYELAACQTFQLCDGTRPELTDILGDAVPTYTSAASLGEAVRYYLKRPGERRELAHAASECVKGHTFTERAEFMMSKIA